MKLANQLCDIADELENRKLFKFAEQLRAAGMSVSNNIAEGSASFSKREFFNFLNIARRSAFEDANISILLDQRGLIKSSTLHDLLDFLDHLCRRITLFQKSL